MSIDPSQIPAAVRKAMERPKTLIQPGWTQKSMQKGGDPWCEACRSWHPKPEDKAHHAALMCMAPWSPTRPRKPQKAKKAATCMAGQELELTPAEHAAYFQAHENTEGVRFTIPGAVMGKPDVDKIVSGCQSQGMQPRPKRSHQKASDQELIDSYALTGNVWTTAKQFGMCGQSVHERLQKLGAIEEWMVTDEEKEKIRAFYELGFINGDGKLDAFCSSIGRTKPLVSRLARKMGLTNAKRPCSDALKKINGDRVREQWKLQPHPRGALVMKHGPAALEKMSKASQAAADRRTKTEKVEISEKMMRTRFTKYGTRAPVGAGRGSWKASWVELDGKRFFARSRWEANYARFLQFMKLQNQIIEWDHEPETFWFEKIKRGVRSYLPDFRVTYWEGTIEYHEVKGWMDSRSKTTINRMRIYHPAVVLKVIDAKWFKANGRKMAGLIPGWDASK